MADTDKGSAFAGTVFYTGDQFPPSFAGNLFRLAFVLNRVYRVELSGDRVVAHALFVRAEGGPVDLVLAPDGSLVNCEWIGGSIKRFRSVAAAQSSHANSSEGAVDRFVPAGRLCGVGVLGAALLTLTVCSRGWIRR